MDRQFKVSMELVEGTQMQFLTTFDKEHFPKLMFDEPESVPGGQDEFPNASRVLAASMANCLSASMMFCLIKSRMPADQIKTEAVGTISRNEKGFWRVSKVDVKLHVKYGEIDDKIRKKFEFCKERFFDYCIVSASIKEGIEINVDTILEQI